MRTLLVVNPAATTTSARTRAVLASALGSESKVDVVETTHRGHARQLAAQAALDGLDAVIVLGGDGTINEAVNGLLQDGPRAGLPALGIVPGGCANVFARSLGLPVDPVEATGQLLDALRAGRGRLVGLGRVEERYFTFCAGVGLDAATVARVERRRGDGAAASTAGYLRAAVVEFFTGIDRRHPELAVLTPDGARTPVHMALVCNTSPWTYLGARPVRPCPRASLDTGLDVFALTRMGTLTFLRHLGQSLARSGRGPHGRAVLGLHDLAEVRIQAQRAQPLQADGEFLGEHTDMRFTSVPAALHVLV